MPPNNSIPSKLVLSRFGPDKNVKCRWSSEITHAGTAPAIKVVLTLKLELRHLPSDITVEGIAPVPLTKEEPHAVAQMMNRMPQQMMLNLQQRVVDFYIEDKKLHGLWTRLDAGRSR
jgi:hypothetical protein